MSEDYIVKIGKVGVYCQYIYIVCIISWTHYKFLLLLLEFNYKCLPVRYAIFL